MMGDLTLYGVAQAILDILEGQEWTEEWVDEETGEIKEETYDITKLDDLNMTLKDKVEGCAYVIANKQATIDALDREIRALQERKRHLKGNLDNLKAYVASNLSELGGRMELPEMTLSIRRTKAVEVYDMDALPDEYKREKITISPDKVAIKEAIEYGLSVPGAGVAINEHLITRR